MIQLLNANALHIPLADHSVHCVVTSPPYYGLRSYGIGTENGEIGLEQTPDEYVANLVAVFQELRRVLRDDGTAWLNLGDSYAGNGRGGNVESITGIGKDMSIVKSKRGAKRWGGGNIPAMDGLKPKDLIGIPWRVAFALQADGWYLRSDIIWHKPNPMPESVKDRPTKSHEYIFLLSKSAKYYYDAEAVKEDSTESTLERGKYAWNGRVVIDDDGKERRAQPDRTERMGERWCSNLRNRRTVWTMATKPYSGAHFAAYPPELIEPCILAGCPEGGMVLDPFAGTGTTLQVARQYNRNAIGLDLSMTYIQECAMERLQLRQLREWGNGKQAEVNFSELPLFGEFQ